MTLYKPMKGKIINDNLEILTDSGHKISFKVIPKISVDLKSETEDNKPFFFVEFNHIYVDTVDASDSTPLSQIRSDYKNANLLTPDLEYDHIQLGFVYSEGDPNNHKWMLNFMDVNNKFLFGYTGTDIKINCPFTTTSWEDGNWHGRFVVYKKDIDKLIEPVEGSFELIGKGDIGKHKVTVLESKVDHMSLRYNIHSNVWVCDLLSKGKKIGEMLGKNIICDVPFVGKVDKSSLKPKVTAQLNVKDIKGISMALNALIIKKK